MTNGRQSIVIVLDRDGLLLGHTAFPERIAMPLDNGRVVIREYSPSGFMQYVVVALSLVDTKDGEPNDQR